jgi:hypothetical protein
MIPKMQDMYRVQKQIRNSGIVIAKMMEKYQYIGVYTLNEQYTELIKWIESLFNFFEYKDCTMIAPNVGYCDEDEKDIHYYDALIMLKINFEQNINECKFRKTTSVEYNIDKFMPVLEITFNLTFFENDDMSLILTKYVDNGAGILKSEERKKEMLLRKLK